MLRRRVEPNRRKNPAVNLYLNCVEAGSEERALADRLYGDLQATGLEVLYDDRDANPGEKFTDAELLGCPLRATVGRRTLAAGEVEVQIRRGREARTVPLEDAAASIARLSQELP